MFYDNLQNLCIKNGITVTALLQELKLSTSKGTAWKGGSLPKYDTIRTIAKYFSVPVYVLFMEGRETPTVELSQEHGKLIKLYEKINSKGKMKVMGYMEGLSECKEFTEEYSTELANGKGA